MEADNLSINIPYSFLTGGGKMGTAMRTYNWAASSLGQPGQWPTQLQVTLCNLLHTPLPAFLLWGKDYSFFYNDAYADQLMGKQPSLVTDFVTAAKDMRHWPAIKAVADGVLLTGRPRLEMDYAFEVAGNGHLETTYWKFSYSPVMDGQGQPAGVLVCCIKNDRVQPEPGQAEDNRFYNLIMQAPMAIALFKGFNLVAEVVNDAYLPLVGKNRADFIGKPLFESLPEARAVLEPLAHNLLKTGIPFPATEFEIVLNRNGTDETCYFNSVWEPVREHDGHISGMMVIAHEVTGQVLARKKAEASEQRLLTVLTETPVGTAILTGPDMRVEMFNNAMLHIWKRDAAIKGQPLMNAIPELRDQHFPRTLANVYTTGEPYLAKEELAYFSINGALTPGYFNYSYTAMRNTGGDVYGILVLANDVTEAVAAKKKIEESEQRFRNLVSQATVGIVVLMGPELEMHIANDFYCKVIGKRYEEVIGRPVFDVIPETETYLRSKIERVWATGAALYLYDYPYFVYRQGQKNDGYLDLVCQPYKENGQVKGVMVLVHDVTGQVLARKALEYAEERARLAINSTDLGAYEANTLTGEMQTNERFNAIFGFTAPATRDEYAAVIHPDDNEVRQKAHEASLATGHLHYEARVIWKDRSVHWVKVKGRIFYNEAAQPFKIIGIVQDITDQKQFAEALTKEVDSRTKELAEANKSLQQSNRELEQFAYIASHDLQEPLRKVSTFTHMLQSSLGEVDESQARLIQKIIASTARMQTLIRNVLSFSQLSNEKDGMEQVNLNEIVENIQSDFELLIAQKEATIVYKHLPTLNAIPLQMHQLFTNLFSNALKFSRAGIKPVIEIATTLLSHSAHSRHPLLNKGTAYVDITFKDNGIGFSQENAEQIFNIFQRLHGRSEYEGTGIGLAMCKKIVQNHGGEIYAVASKDAGAVFHLLFPLSNLQ